MDNQFIRNYDLFLKTRCGCHHNSALKHLKNLKKIVRIAIANGWVTKDPFFGIRFTEQETHVEFLTKEGLDTLVRTEFKMPQHNQVRDIFYFCALTSLAFADVKTLKPEHIIADNDGTLWIRKPRQKTGVMCNVPLIPPAVALIEKYTSWLSNHSCMVFSPFERHRVSILSAKVSNLVIIDLILRYGNGGRLFGATFIDHNSRTVINGSALGKDFAANALGERFPDLANESRENKCVLTATPMIGEDVMHSAQRTLSGERDRTTTTAIFVPLAERTQNVSTPAPLPTDDALHQTVWPTRGDHEATIQRESDSTDQSPYNNDQSLGNTGYNPDSHLAIPDLSSIGDAAGSLFSILTPDPGGQTTDKRPVRRPQPPKKKKGRSM